MIRKLVMVIGGLTVATAGLFAVSSRGLSNLTGLFRASAEEAVDNLAKQVPDEIHDRKTENELHVARQQLIDRQVELNLSRTQVDQLRKETQSLQDSLTRRQRLLAEAYPAMKQAVDQRATQVRFASTDFTMADFQKEVDGLLAQQQREQRQLEIKRDGLTRLEKSLGEGEQALTEMRTALEGLDQELAVLKSRREQAQIEASTLDLVSSATNGQQTVASNVGQSVDRLKHEVRKLEARNEARRGLAPAAERPENQLGRAWSRLETLKAYHDEFTAKPADDGLTQETQSASSTAPEQPAAAVASPVCVDATEVLIKIRPEDKGAAKKTKKTTEKK
ncbi:MAG: hypothetical protein NTY19_32150 [Planctomycetota bacterium]|nr:hypothetical protein [Planctomycetota bacterium]